MVPPVCRRYASFPPAEAIARIFGSVNPVPNLGICSTRLEHGRAT
jgi:hypothetical protein